MQKIKTALCSFGMSGKVFHAPFIRLHSGFELYAALERSKKEISNLYPGVISYDSLDQLLDDENIQLLIINTPNYTHFDFAKSALAAGKHIVVEKPFCVTTSQCDELIALAVEKDKQIAVYQNRRWDSDFSTVKKVVEENLLGEIVEAEFHFDRYDQQLSYKLHKETPGPGAGLLYDLGPHLLDQALQLFGMPAAIFADIEIMRPVSKVDDYFELLLQYDKLRVRLKAGYLVREPLPAYILHGRSGSFIKERGDVQEAALKLGQRPDSADWGTEPISLEGLLHTELNGETVRKNIPTERGDYGKFYALLFEALRKGTALPVTAQEGRNVIALIESALQSTAEKKWISI
jgi:predicted dehydrogenase